MLGAACATSSLPEARRWAEATGPLIDVVADLVLAWLPRQAYPIRHGKHQNDAFALTLLIEAYGLLGRDDVVTACRERALAWFGDDRDAPTGWEPSGSDFLSPALTEAMLMRRVLESRDFVGWLDAFLPGVGQGRHEHLMAVPEVTDPTDGQLAHLLGLALSRAWQLRELAEMVDPAVAVGLRAGADRQEAAVVEEITRGHFMATHWLVSFGLLARGELTRDGSGGVGEGGA